MASTSEKLRKKMSLLILALTATAPTSWTDNTMSSSRKDVLEGLDNAGKAAVATKMYGLLGLVPGCGEGEIRTAYRKASRLYHPDKQQGKDVNAKEAAAAMFLKIQEAYEVLETQRPGLDAAWAATERAKKVQADRTAAMDEKRRRMRDDVERREAQARSATKPPNVETMRRRNAQASDRYDEERRKATADAEIFAVSAKKSQKDADAKRSADRARRSLKVKWPKSSVFSTDDLTTIFERLGPVDAVDHTSNKHSAVIVFIDEDTAVAAALDEAIASRFKDLRLCSHDAFDRVQSAVKKLQPSGAAVSASGGTPSTPARGRDWSLHRETDDDDVAPKRARLDTALRQLRTTPVHSDPALAQREFDTLSRLLTA